MIQFLNLLWQDESGATAIEYGLIAGIMAALLVTVLGGFSDKLDLLFQAITGKLEKVTDKIKESDVVVGE